MNTVGVMSQRKSPGDTQLTADVSSYTHSVAYVSTYLQIKVLASHNGTEGTTFGEMMTWQESTKYLLLVHFYPGCDIACVCGVCVCMSSFPGMGSRTGDLPHLGRTFLCIAYKRDQEANCLTDYIYSGYHYHLP